MNQLTSIPQPAFESPTGFAANRVLSGLTAGAAVEGAGAAGVTTLEAMQTGQQQMDALGRTSTSILQQQWTLLPISWLTHRI